MDCEDCNRLRFSYSSNQSCTFLFMLVSQSRTFLFMLISSAGSVLLSEGPVLLSALVSTTTAFALSSFYKESASLSSISRTDAV